MSRMGQTIKDVRTRKGLSPKALGKKIGVSESFVQEIESGRRIINEGLIARLSKVLDTNLNETGSFYTTPDDSPLPEKKPSSAIKTKTQTPPSPQWENAFTSIIADIPVYDSRMEKITDNRKAVVVNNRVEGLPPDKAFYYQVEESDNAALRLRRGDLVLVQKQNEVQGTATYLIRQDGIIKIRQIKLVENRLLLMASHQGSLTAETVSPQQVVILGRCVKAEITM